MTQQVLPTVGVTAPWGNVLSGFLSQSLTPSGFLTTVSTLTSANSPYTVNTGSFSYSSGLPANGSGTTNNGSPIWTGETLLCNPTSGNITVNLPNPGAVSGFYPIHTIKRITSSSNTITITPTSASIDQGSSGTSITLPTTIGAGITLISDGTNWWTYHTSAANGLIPPGFGGTGVANNAASTLTISGSFGITFTVSATTSLTLPTSGTVAAKDSNSNLSANSFIGSYTSTATAAGTTTLTVSSTYFQVFTGSSTQTVVMPVTSTLVQGMQWLIMNNSTGGAVTIQSSAGGSTNNIVILGPNASVILTCISTSGTSPTSWYQSQNRTVKRVYSSSTPSVAPMGSVSTDLYDVVHLTSQTTNITGMTPATSSPADGDVLRISITGSSTSITWGTSYAASNTVPLPTQTISTNRLDVGFVYDSVAAVWRCVAVA